MTLTPPTGKNVLLDHAAWLNASIGQVLAGLGIAEFFSMHVARAAMPLGAALCAWVAIWAFFLGLAFAALGFSARFAPSVQGWRGLGHSWIGLQG